MVFKGAWWYRKGCWPQRAPCQAHLVFWGPQALPSEVRLPVSFPAVRGPLSGHGQQDSWDMTQHLGSMLRIPRG